MKNRFRNPLILAGCLIFAAIIFWIDYQTTQRYSFYLFYFPPIIVSAWFFKRSYAYAMAGICLILWTIARARLYVPEVPPPFYWNAIVRLATFWVVVVSIRIIRSKNEIIRIQTEELKRSNEELEQFAFKAAHDLKSPLAGIQNGAEFLKEEYENSGNRDAQEMVNVMLRSLKRMNLLIQNLLDYSRVTNKELPCETVDFAQLLQSVLTGLSRAIEERKAVVTTGPLPILEVNRSLMSQVFQNLVENATKYCEKKPRIKFEAFQKGKEWVFLVKDNGIGIAKEYQERIFIMFEKVPVSKHYAGTGIGLATCKKIIERFGGRIWVESNPEGGSIFKFTLPIK